MVEEPLGCSFHLGKNIQEKKSLIVQNKVIAIPIVIDDSSVTFWDTIFDRYKNVHILASTIDYWKKKLIKKKQKN